MRAAILFTSLAAAAVEIAVTSDALPEGSHPDCKNGPLSINKICDPLAGKHSIIKKLVSSSNLLGVTDTISRAKALISLFRS